MKKSEIQPVVKVAVVLSPLEAALIKHLRKFEFGDLLVKKKEGAPYQVIVSESNILRYDEGLDLEESFAIPRGSELESKEVITLEDLDKFFESYNGKENK